MTSSDAVVRVKKILNEKTVGHMGTLDPNAAGVLPVALGKGTKLFNYFIDKKKRYRAGITFGKTTDTLDSYGAVTEQNDKIPAFEAVDAAVKKLTGEILQSPPAYSSISVGGSRSYALARRGVAPQLEARWATVYDFKILSFKNGVLSADIICGGGTYIRSLARDLGGLCGTVAYMSSLIRLSAGIFDIEDSLTLDELAEKKSAPPIVEIERFLADMPSYVAEENLYKAIANGVQLEISPQTDRYFKVYCKGEFFGIGEAVQNRLSIKTYLKIGTR
jgi:tRNA pseudouridine55 synthase